MYKVFPKVMSQCTLVKSLCPAILFTASQIYCVWIYNWASGTSSLVSNESKSREEIAIFIRRISLTKGVNFIEPHCCRSVHLLPPQFRQLTASCLIFLLLSFSFVAAFLAELVILDWLFLALP